MPHQGSSLNRSAILARYRDRIAGQEKTKLTHNEQTDLVADFIADLQRLDTPDAIQQRCVEEMALLEEGYPIATIASRMLAPYRKAIRDAIEAGTLPLNDRTGHIVRYTKRATGEEQETMEHWALTHLKYDPATYAALRGQTIEHNNARQDELQPVQVDAYLAAVTELLTEDDPHALTAAIAAATGRRHTEVAVRGTFAPTAHPYVLTFTGQQKKRDGHFGASTPFDIVTIVPARAVLNALDRLRQHPGMRRIQRETSVQASALRAFNTQVNRIVKKTFEETGIVPRVAGARSVSIHRLRGVYAALAVYLWCPPGQHEHRFIQHYLGHILKEANLPNSSATTHYFHYRLLDGDGQPLHAKGILRDRVGPPPDTIAPAPTPPTTPRHPTLAAADLDRLYTVTDQLGMTGSLAERFHALLDWASTHHTLGTELASRAKPAAPIENTPAEMPPRRVEQPQETTNEPSAHAAQPPEILPIVSDQAKTMAWLTEEITTLRQQLANAQQADAELRTLHNERSILQAKIDSLTGENKILQRRLERFESLGRALWGSDDIARPTPQTAPATAGAMLPDRAGEDPQPHPTHRPATTTDGLGSRGQERAARIWQTIQAWNDTLGRPQHEKVALTASVLEKRFGLFRPTAKTFLERHQHAIEAHNQMHGITAAAHNRTVPDTVWETLKAQAR